MIYFAILITLVFSYWFAKTSSLTRRPALKQYMSALIGIIGFIYVIRHTSDVRFLSYVPEEVKDINGSFEGVVVDKKQAHSNELYIKTGLKTIRKYGIDDSLFILAKIGDGIFKIPNDDSVLLIKDGKKVKLQYKWISDDTNDSPFWPKEWKNKWMQTNLK